jgi:hypothetical protein
VTQVWLLLGIIFIAGSSMLGSVQYDLEGGLAGLFFGLIVSFAALYAIFISVDPPKHEAETPESRSAARFPLSNCLWGPLSFAAGVAIYEAVSSIADRDPAVAWIVPPMLYDLLYDLLSDVLPDGLFVPPLKVDLSLLPVMRTTVDKALFAFQTGVPIAATLAFFAALIRPRRGRLRISGIAWIPVAAASAPGFIMLFGLGRPPQVWFAAMAVTLAGFLGFLRPNDELPYLPTATGRVLFLVLEAVYAGLIASLASVIVMEVISGTDGMGYVIVQSMQTFDIARTVAAVALVWLAAALLSFVVRCAQSIVVEVAAGDRATP